MPPATAELTGYPAALSHCLRSLDADSALPEDPAVLVEEWMGRLERSFAPRGAALYLLDPAGTPRRVAGSGVLPPDKDWGATALSSITAGPVLVSRPGAEVALAPVAAGRRVLGAVVLAGCENPAPLDLVRGAAESLGLALAALRATARGSEERDRAEAATDRMIRTERLAGLGRLVAGIAHEINNPLAGMQNCVRTLLRKDRDPERRVQYLEMLQEGLGRINRTVRQLLDFGREARPQLARTALTPIVHRCLALVEHELAARKIACALSLDPALPELVADPHQLEQVFLNIVMNALQAMPAGGTLTVSAGRRGREAGPFVEVRITDTGGGIPPDRLPRIFDPFFTTKEVGEGTGLGLSVSYGIVQAHGGVIEVESEVGSGSTFTIALPAGGAGESDASTDSSGRG